MKTFYKHIRFIQTGDVWECVNLTEGATLGWVEYHAPWSQWVYTSCSDIIYSVSCLIDIADFLQQLNSSQGQANVCVG